MAVTLRAVTKVYSEAQTYDFLPVAIPHAGAEDVFTRDVWIDVITITNTTAGALTFTLADKQVSPVALATAVSIPANSLYTIELFGRLCGSGMTWVASGAGLVGYARGRV